MYHTALAVDEYLRAFDRVPMLRYYRVLKSAICWVMGHSPHLIDEHLALAQQHFATEEALTDYLANPGVELEVVG
ncbi:MAG: hypothetical protein Q8P50_10460 [Bacillota bacterium]|nr:hypothetical protein [Bacillota bacterium]